MLFRSICIVLAASMLLGGCAIFDDQVNRLKAGARVSPFIARNGEKGAGGYIIDDVKMNVVELRRSEPRPVNLDQLELPGISGSAYVAAAQPGGNVARNRLQDYLLRVSDDVCLEHKSDILAVASMLNTGFSGATSIVGGLGSIVTGEVATRALSGSAAILNGLRDDVNQNVYYNNVANAIIKKIDQQRLGKLEQILSSRSADNQAYNVDAAIRDAAAYHHLCSFSEGIAGLADDTRRPLTPDEIKGKIDALRSEIEKNEKLAVSTPSLKASLRATNNTLAAMIGRLTFQYSAAQGAPVQPKEAAPAPSGSEKKPTPSDGADSGGKPKDSERN